MGPKDEARVLRVTLEWFGSEMSYIPYGGFRADRLVSWKMGLALVLIIAARRCAVGTRAEKLRKIRCLNRICSSRLMRAVDIDGSQVTTIGLVLQMRIA